MNKQEKTKYSVRAVSLRYVISFLIVTGLIGGIIWPNQSVNESNKTMAVVEKQTLLPEITVYKSATCNCCHKWVSHLENEGFIVKAHNREDMNTVKKLLGVIPGLASCHTATVDGYLIEGHVPAGDIIRLLTEKPEGIVGLTVPGMPRYSPGMQPEGLTPKNYDVLTFDEKGSTVVFTSY